MDTLKHDSTWTADSAIDPLQALLEIAYHRSILHSHKCAECGLDRACGTAGCEYRPMDVNKQGKHWVCIFCNDTTVTKETT
jgi:hypothetical protein